jgi:hypothetical protein
VFSGERVRVKLRLEFGNGRHRLPPPRLHRLRALLQPKERSIGAIPQSVLAELSAAISNGAACYRGFRIALMVGTPTQAPILAGNGPA